MTQPTDHRDTTVGDCPAAADRSRCRGPLGPGALAVGLGSDVMGQREASPAELLERLCNDQVRCWRAGHRVPVESYLARHPRVRDDDEATFELIYGEFLLREDMGEPPPVDEFRQRFPDFAERLQRQLDLHEVLRADDAGATGAADHVAKTGNVARDRLSALKREGRLEGRRGPFVDDRALDAEVSTCEADASSEPVKAPE